MSTRILQDARAIVTGASSGIGRELAAELAGQGVQVILVARREGRLRELTEQIRAAGGRAHLIAGDITDPAVRRQAIDAARSQFGGLDVLVNNAGVGARGLFEDADPARARKIMEVNFFALVEMTRLALPLLKEGRRPMVVNVSSILGHRGVPHCSEYCASKFAVQGFSEAIRAEFTRHGIDVFVVSPGITATEFSEHLIERTSQPAWPEHKAMPAAEVARRTVRAIRAGRHEVMPSTPAKLLYWLNRLAPRLVDRLVTRYA